MAEHKLPDDTIDDSDDNPNTEHHGDMRGDEDDDDKDKDDAET